VGEFSPIGRLFSLGNFMKITEVAQIFSYFMPRQQNYVLIVTKTGSGCILGDFFTNSSGHPDLGFPLRPRQTYKETQNLCLFD
jgi:hypothetical protein